MAPDCTGGPVGTALCFDFLETTKLKLDAEHIPFTVSVFDAVLEHYLESDAAEEDAPVTPAGQLLELLRQFDAENTELDVLLQMISQQVNAEEQATLQWLEQALAHFRQQYSLAPELAASLQQLDVTTTALALTDDLFLIPGAHPYHRLLDTVQSCAVGWQDSLGRAGQALQKQINTAIDRVHQWFTSGEGDLESICDEAIAAIQRDQARAQRMAQRLVETEQGRIKAASAKEQAANMINTALQGYALPTSIGDFLKGPWYDSAQLVWLKHGPDSQEWQEMEATTESLCTSLQGEGENGSEDRQALFERVSAIPKEIRRWLFSLQHDSNAIADAVRLVEAQHVQVLKEQPLNLEKIDLLFVSGAGQSLAHDPVPDTVAELEEGQWFAVSHEGENLRIQLTLDLADEQQLLFTNQAGMKALQQSYSEFAAALANNSAYPLDSGAGFSLSLAAAAGMGSTEAYEEFVAELERIQHEEAERLAAEEAERQRAEEEAERQRQEAQEQQRAEEEARQRQEEAERQAEEQRQQEAQEKQRAEEEAQRQRKEAERLEREAQEREAEEEAAKAAQEAEEIERMQREQETSGLLAEDLVTLDDEIEEVEYPDLPAADEPEIGTAEVTPEPAGEPDVAEEDCDFELNVPMGAWLGFHDGETPMMAKLAVHDRESDRYIFVNREGIKLRELSRAEMMDLIERDMVDILETRTTFRDAVQQLKKSQS